MAFLTQTCISSGLLGSISSKTFDCMFCHLCKQIAPPFNDSISVASKPFDLIHSGIWGVSPIPTMGGSRYFVIFVDDFSCFTWIYLFCNHSELF